MFNHEEMFKALFRVLLCHLKGHGVEKKLIYCESLREEMLFQMWLRIQLMRKLITNGTVNLRVN